MKTRNCLTLVVVVSFIFLGFKKDKVKIYPGYSYMPGGAVKVVDSVYNITPFYISQLEITNVSYRLFLDYLKQTGKKDDLTIAEIQDEKWNKLPFGEPYKRYYSNHPAYNDYPVVNISNEAAMLYCKWLTSQLTDKTLEYRLPTKAEWIYAAQGGLTNSEYSWKGMGLRGRDGEALCNYKMIGDYKIHEGSKGLEIIDPPMGGGSITLQAKSFKPNDWGLYNVCGNVAEMICEKGIAMGGSWNNPGYDVRIRSEQIYTEPSPFIGFRVVLARKIQ